MKIYLTMVLLLLSCLRYPANHAVRFAKPWDSPFRVSDTYRHHLVNESGEYLYVLNKTAWAYFVCQYPEKVLENARKHGANVIRVCLEGAPYAEHLKYDLWPWGGTRRTPDFNSFNREYLDNVEERIQLAGRNGIGLDVVLYFDLKPQVTDLSVQKKYCDMILSRFSKYSNILAWEIMNEESSNESFQDSIATYIAKRDPFRHPVISSDGTTDDALWPQKKWMSMAVVHTCTGNQPEYDLNDWYLNIARNTRQHGKPAFNNESGRERRHKNDDPVHRRKQGWLFANAGCFWTWHSWDGCEGINDTTYFMDGWHWLAPMRKYYESIPFWQLEPNTTVFNPPDFNNYVYTTMSSPDREISVVYCCTRKTNESVEAGKAHIRLKDGLYLIRFLDPTDLRVVGESELRSKGLREREQIDIPSFRDDLIIEISVKRRMEKTLMEGTF